MALWRFPTITKEHLTVMRQAVRTQWIRLLQDKMRDVSNKHAETGQADPIDYLTEFVKTTDHLLAVQTPLEFFAANLGDKKEMKCPMSPDMWDAMVLIFEQDYGAMKNGSPIVDGVLEWIESHQKDISKALQEAPSADPELAKTPLVSLPPRGLN